MLSDRDIMVLSEEVRKIDEGLFGLFGGGGGGGAVAVPWKHIASSYYTQVRQFSTASYEKIDGIKAKIQVLKMLIAEYSKPGKTGGTRDKLDSDALESLQSALADISIILSNNTLSGKDKGAKLVAILKPLTDSALKATQRWPGESIERIADSLSEDVSINNGVIFE